MKKGLLIILSGPSGVGKGTVRKRIMKNEKLNLVYSISMTTRVPRNMEQDGQDYYFVSQEEFQKNIDNNNFLEWAEFVGNRYGTPKNKVEELRSQGKNVFLEIEINGAEQVLDKVKDEGVISFFLMPPSLKALEKRIRNRRSESEEIIFERLEKGKKEMTMTKDYDYIVLNDRVGRASSEITHLILKKIHQNNL
ncbi:MAG: guanylate kinase [Bacilli bacterium]|jgi:guanylate kinase|nr:guanylate kinase [Bacilli bacterium]MDD3068695.1 guanylate kinase [Bacilli bacterium]MDD3841558.1 guanylate kinase [Bacilli bacterium]HKM10395.1 guanylate kinase [Bacilli bacterium]